MDPLTLTEFKKLYIHKLLNGARARTKKHGWPIDQIIGTDDLINLWERCKGHCSVSGRYFSLDAFDECLVKHPYAPSLDRKDCSKGYTPSNTRLVCVAVNFGINQWGVAVYRELAEAAVEHGKIAELEQSTNHWAQQQRAIIQDIERQLVTVDGADKARLRHVLAGHKAALTKGPEVLRRAANEAVANRKQKCLGLPSPVTGLEPVLGK